MKNKIMTTTLLLSLLLTLFSCSNISQEKSSPKSDSKAYLVISPGLVSLSKRSINPSDDYVFNNLKDIYFYGQKSDGTRKTLLSNIGSLTEVYSQLILLEDGAGSYTFELRGSLDSICFYQKLENVEIKDSETNTISFELSPVKSSSDLETPFEDYGGIDIKLKYKDANVNKVVITVEDLATNEKIDGEEIPLYSTSGTRTVEYKRWTSYSTSSDTGRIAVGTYRVTFDFYCTTIQTQTKVNGDTEIANQTQLLNSFPYVVHVEKGRNSVFEDTIDLNEVYTITYKDNFGSNSGGLLESQTKVTRYTRKSENIILPRLYRAYYLFEGWFTAQEGGERITNIPTGSFGNITVYAHWQALGAGGSNEVLYVNPDASYHYGTSEEYGLSNITEALEVISKSSAVYHHNWTIKIKGSVSGSYTIDDSDYTFKTYADAVLFEGISESQNGEPADEINGGFKTATENGNVLSIITKNRVGIRNLKITGGNNSGSGGGIYVGPEADVSLLENALISENQAEYGGGLYVDGGTVEMYGNAGILKCSSKIGGGIYIASGSVTMNNDSYIEECTGSKITGVNDINSAGGVDVASDGVFIMNDYSEIINCSGSNTGAGGLYLKGTFTMNGGMISDNKTGIYYNNVQYGAGGVYIDGGNFTMNGGTISNNSSAGCGGVLVSGSAITGMGTFDMQGGVISGNTSDNTSSNKRNEGVTVSSSTRLTDNVTLYGTFKMGRDAEVSDDNVVNLPGDSVLTVTGPLEKDHPATITRYKITEYTTGAYEISYTSGSIAIALEEGAETTLAQESVKFLVKRPVNSSTGTSERWIINENGELKKLEM